jgi:cell division protein FtsB
VTTLSMRRSFPAGASRTCHPGRYAALTSPDPIHNFRSYLRRPGSGTIRRPEKFKSGEGMSDKRKPEDEPKPAPSEQVVLATLENERTWAMTVRYVAITISLGLLLVLATPLARAIAGKNTNFNVNVTMALTATFALSTVAALAYGRNQRARADHLDRRNRQLERQVEELNNKLDKLQ